MRTSGSERAEERPLGDERRERMKKQATNHHYWPQHRQHQPPLLLLLLPGWLAASLFIVAAIARERQDHPDTFSSISTASIHRRTSEQPRDGQMSELQNRQSRKRKCSQSIQQYTQPAIVSRRATKQQWLGQPASQADRQSRWRTATKRPSIPPYIHIRPHRRIRTHTETSAHTYCYNYTRSGDDTGGAETNKQPHRYQPTIVDVVSVPGQAAAAAVIATLTSKIPTGRQSSSTV